MKKINLFLLFAVLPLLVVSPLFHGSAVALDSFVFAGKVTDIAGAEVEGAEIFIYDTANTRRPADFITARTAADGLFRITLPRKKYWAVARVRKSDKYGPLSPGDKHSGEPVEVEPDVEKEVRQNFVVADLKDIAQSRPRKVENYYKVKGRITDSEGAPVENAYIFAYSKKCSGETPDFLSMWSDNKGESSIYLPVGTYFIGAATKYPLPGKPSCRKITVDGVTKGVVDLSIAINGPKPLEFDELQD